MIKKYYTGQPVQRGSDAPVELPVSTRRQREDPQGYLPDPGLIEAANVALILGSPLLLTGDPGVGKSTFAASLAYGLGLGRPLRFEAKSTSIARDLFYTFDTLGRFKSDKKGETNLDFIFWQALGEAIIRSRPRAEVSHLVVDKMIDHDQPRRSVVLIDEIDKAPRDFPNDLLNEIEKRSFRVPELDNRLIEANEELMPILVLTSNSETNLPEAFLRRCIYYHIPFPEPNNLEEIVTTRVGRPVAEDALLKDAIELFYELRKSAGLTKPPSIAELIEWLYVLPQTEVDKTASLKKQPGILNGTLSILVKTREDRERAGKVISNWQKS